MLNMKTHLKHFILATFLIKDNIHPKNPLREAKTMVKVKPFEGIMYNKEKIDKLENVMSPPYDIISDEMQNTLYDKHPYNFVRLILGKQKPTDDEQDNRYTRAKEQFD